MDARTALNQISELIDDIQSEAPECADRIRDAVSEARDELSAGKSEAPPHPEKDQAEEDKPTDFKSARQAAMADKSLFGRDKTSEESDPNEPESDDDEDDKKKRDRAKAY